MLQMSEDRLQAYTAEDISGLLDKVRPILDYRRELYKRYTRKDGPFDVIGADRRKKVVSFEYYITNMVKGYVGGKAPQYNVRKGDGQADAYVQEFNAAIDDLRRYNDDAATYMELVHDYLICCAAYLYVYENKANQIVYTRFDARQTVGIFDYATPPNQIGILRTWPEEDSKGNAVAVVELVDKTKRRTFRQKDQGFADGELETLLWNNDVPAVSFENPDNIAVFEPAISDIEDYEQIRQNIRSMTQYNDDAKLLLEGYHFEHDATITDEAGNVTPNPARLVEEQAILNARTIGVDSDGDIRWLLKNVDYSGMLEVLRSLHDEITMLTGVPNMTDEAFANADNASALGYKLYALDQYSATLDRVFRKGYLRLWELICGRWGLKGRAFDFRDIDVVMQRNIPTDRDKSISRAATMKSSGLFSDETCINESQVEVDPAEEIAKRNAEADEDFDRALKRTEAAGGPDGDMPPEQSGEGQNDEETADKR